MLEPKLLAQSSDLSGEDNFPAGCSLSPDGLCLLTWTAADSLLRIYNTVVPKESDESRSALLDWKTALSCHGGNAVRSYSWYPLMKSSEPASCCFLAAARNQPVQLHDAYTGNVRASYRPYNALDEMESATVACFHPSGTQLVASGFRTDRTLHMFDTAVPGRESTVWRLGKTRRSSDGQKGLVSSLAYAPDGNYLAVGTYAPGSIYMYDHRIGATPSGTVLNGVCVVGHGRSHARKKRRFVAVEGPAGPEGDDEDSSPNWLSSAKIKWFHTKAQSGVTQLQFAPQPGYLLYSVSRRSNTVLTWDLRMLSDDPDFQSNPIGGIASFETRNDTNQRLEFDLDETGRYLYVGGQDGCVRMYSTETGEFQGRIEGLKGPASGVSCRRVPSSSDRSFLAVASGARRFPSEEKIDSDNDALPSKDPPGALQLYELGAMQTADVDSVSEPLSSR